MNPTIFQEKWIPQFFKKNESYNFSRKMNPTVFQEKRILQFFKKNESYNFSRQINPTIFQKNESTIFQTPSFYFLFNSNILYLVWLLRSWSLAIHHFEYLKEKDSE